MRSKFAALILAFVAAVSGSNHAIAAPQLAIISADLGAGMDAINTRPSVEAVQYRRPVRCGDGADRDIRDGLCYPTGTVPPEFQAARLRYPVRCGDGADRDIRDGRCYPTGTVPLQFQAGRLYEPRYNDDEDNRPPRRRYY